MRTTQPHRPHAGPAKDARGRGGGCAPASLAHTVRLESSPVPTGSNGDSAGDQRDVGSARTFGQAGYPGNQHGNEHQHLGLTAVELNVGPARVHILPEDAFHFLELNRKLGDVLLPVADLSSGVPATWDFAGF